MYKTASVLKEKPAGSHRVDGRVRRGTETLRVEGREQEKGPGERTMETGSHRQGRMYRGSRKTWSESGVAFRERRRGQTDWG